MKDEALMQCQNQLTQLKKEFEEFVYLVSHDLNAPIRAISNLSGWIMEDLGENMPVEVQQNINLLQDRAQRLEKMLGAILILSRVSRTDVELSFVELPALLKDIIQKFEPYPITVTWAQDINGITTYHKKLQTVLTELVGNAVKHHEKSKLNIHIDVKITGRKIEFKISDNGPGIPADAQEKIFSLFYTVNGKEGNENLGAGLTIARSIAQFVGGNLTLINPLEGKGASFLLQWPISKV